MCLATSEPRVWTSLRKSQTESNGLKSNCWYQRYSVEVASLPSTLQTLGSILNMGGIFWEIWRLENNSYLISFWAEIKKNPKYFSKETLVYVCMRVCTGEVHVRTCCIYHMLIKKPHCLNPKSNPLKPSSAEANLLRLKIPSLVFIDHYILWVKENATLKVFMLCELSLWATESIKMTSKFCFKTGQGKVGLVT